MKKTFCILAIQTILIFTACSKTDSTNNSILENKSSEIAVARSNSTRSKTVTPEKTSSKSSEISEACLMLPKEEVEKIVGAKVENSDSEIISKASDNLPSTNSTCNYDFAENRSITFFVRRSNFDEQTPKEIQNLKDALKTLGIEKIEDVSGIGTSAFWGYTDKSAEGGNLGQLSAFKGERVYIFLQMYGLKNETEAKEKATKLAQTAIAKF